MSTTAIVCSQCGAPLTIPGGVDFVTCNHCQGALTVRREASVTYTQTLDKVARQTEEIAEHLAELRHERELERIDREWRQERASLLITNRRGGTYAPSKAAGLFAIVIGGGFGIVWTAFSLSIASHMPGLAAVFPLFGIVFILMALGLGVSTIAKANTYQRAETAYRRRRAALSEEDPGEE